MSDKELGRLEAVRRCLDRRLTQAEAAQQLGVGERQVQRLCRAYRADGPAGLVSRRRGQPSNRRLDDELRQEVLELVRARYTDFGPTLACEKLAELHDRHVSRETLRKWMVEDGLWVPRKLRRRAQQPRRRRPCVGELIQIDGSDHEWFEERGPRCTLLVFIDDATSQLMELRFVESESTWGYFSATQGYLERYGKPVAFYSDKASIFRPTASSARGSEPGLTQFGRAMTELNIDILCANSPAAKGRVERANATLQDRLVKELRLAGVSTLEDGNAFLERYRVAHNERFAVEPRSDHDVHRPLRSGEDLRRILSWQEERKLSKNLTLRYKKTLLLLEPSPDTQRLVGRRAQIYEWEDGHLDVVMDGRSLPFRVFDTRGHVSQAAVVENKRLGAALAYAQELQKARDEERLENPKVSLREKRWVKDKRSAESRQRPSPDISTLR